VREEIPQGLKPFDRDYSFAPSELAYLPTFHPRLTPWAAFYRRFAAGSFTRRFRAGLSRAAPSGLGSGGSGPDRSAGSAAPPQSHTEAWVLRKSRQYV